jgi:hypothetical protein
MREFIRLSSLVSLLVLAVLLYKYLESNEKYCERVAYYRGLSWNGKVAAKYLDSLNHGYQTVLVKAAYGTNKVDFITDTSRVYQIIQVGDSVEKAKDSLALYITTRNGKKRHPLKYICN